MSRFFAQALRSCLGKAPSARTEARALLLLPCCAEWRRYYAARRLRGAADKYLSPVMYTSASATRALSVHSIDPAALSIRVGGKKRATKGAGEGGGSKVRAVRIEAPAPAPRRCGSIPELGALNEAGSGSDVPSTGDSWSSAVGSMASSCASAPSSRSTGKSSKRSIVQVSMHSPAHRVFIASPSETRPRGATCQIEKDFRSGSNDARASQEVVISEVRECLDHLYEVR